MRINPETKKKIITWSVLILLSLLSILLCYFVAKRGLSDCFIIPGAAYLIFAVLAFIERAGTFDIFVYQFQNLVNSFRKGSPKRYDNAGDYKRAKKRLRDGSRFDYLPYLILGGIYLIVGIVVAFVL